VPQRFYRYQPSDSLLPKLGTSELLGLFLTSGASAFGLFYAAPELVRFTVTFRGLAAFSMGAQDSLGLAGLSLSALVPFAAIISQQLKSSEGSNIGAALIIWTNFVVVLIGDVLFYFAYVQGTILLIGLVSATLTLAGLVTILGRPRVTAYSG
jgi:hypothetical protein